MIKPGAWMADFDLKQQAIDTVEKLALIDAMAERNEYENANLARIDELRVCNSPQHRGKLTPSKNSANIVEALAMQKIGHKARQAMETDKTNTTNKKYGRSRLKKIKTNILLKKVKPSRQYLVKTIIAKDQASSRCALDKVQSVV